MATLSAHGMANESAANCCLGMLAKYFIHVPFYALLQVFRPRPLLPSTWNCQNYLYYLPCSP